MGRVYEALVQVPRGIRFPTRWCRRPQLSHNAPVNSRVHPKYKTRYRVGNWPAYERALVQRGDVTLWLSPDAVAAWTPRLSGRPGGPRKFSDHAIETALTLRLVFRLPLRQTEGFLRSVLTLMATGLDAPDHTTLSRRGQPLDVALDRVPTHGPVDLVVDSTGLSVFGEGEWAAAKHGGRGKRGWKKLHLGVDRSGVIVAQALTAPTSDDATTGVRFVETVPGDVASVTADTAYDTVAFYAAASARDARVVVPPARTASLSRHGPRSRARDRTIRRVQILGWRRWKKASRYPRQARVENVVFSVQVDQRTWSASPHGSRATDRGAPRVRRAESDDRTRSARVLPHRSVRARRSGRLRLNDQSCNNAPMICHGRCARRSTTLTLKSGNFTRRPPLLPEKCDPNVTMSPLGDV